MNVVILQQKSNLPKMKTTKTALTTLMLMAALGTSAQQLTLQLDKAQKAVSPTLYGMMTEEINYSYEGGLYAQILRDPSFREDVNGQRRNPWTPWHSGGPKYWLATDTLASQLTLTQKGGYNRANPAVLKWKAKAGASIANGGFWGVPIRAKEHYKGYVIAKAEKGSGTSFTLSLVSNDGKTVFASTKIDGLGENWQKKSFELTVPEKVKATKDARFVIIADNEGTYDLSKTVLFPETFNNRPNGLRKDLMEMMCRMKPKFLRFPGGNYLEGNDFRNRFDWKRTIGDPDERPGHMSPWGYRSTDGLGLLEFLEWAEDCGAEPILGVFAGYTLSGDHLTADYIDGFVQDALDEIEYVTGGPETKWGAQRVRDGHPQPFLLHYVEIGNEDFFDESGSYAGRYKKLYDAIKAKYPQLQLISTADQKMVEHWAQETGVTGLKFDVIDEHYYRSTGDMYAAVNQYDKYDRKGPKIFCGEWAAREGKPTTNMNAALGDAAWMTGMERNADLLIGHCYAPLFVNVNKGGMQWESDLIGYDALNAYGSPSYYAQCMFAQNVGNRIVPMVDKDMPTMEYEGKKLPQLYYSATTDTQSGHTYLKVVNGGKTAQTLTVTVSGGKVAGKGTITTLKAAKPEDTNSIDNPKHVVPVTAKQKTGKTFKVVLAPLSVNVIKM